MNANIFVVVICGMLFAGCGVNGFTEFYNQSILDENLAYLKEKHKDIFLHKGNKVQIIASNDLEADIRTIMNNGAIILGQSGFRGGCQDSNKAITQAKKIGATHILVKIVHIDTKTATGSIAMPTTQTSTTQGNVNAFGSGGYAFGNYNSTTTTSGIAYMPYSYNVYICNHDAIYFIFR